MDKELSQCDDNRVGWERWSAYYQAHANLPTEVVHYQEDIVDEDDLHLCGEVEGSCVVELGCGGGQGSIAFARKGAFAVGVDFSAEQLRHAKILAELNNVRPAWVMGDMRQLGMLRDRIADVVFSSWAFGYVGELSTVFKEAFRIMKPLGRLVFAMGHPINYMIDDSHPEQPLLIRRSYFDEGPVNYAWNGVPFTDYHRTTSTIVQAALGAGFTLTALHEPPPLPNGVRRSMFWSEAFKMVPHTLIIQAVKAPSDGGGAGSH